MQPRLAWCNSDYKEISMPENPIAAVASRQSKMVNAESFLKRSRKLQECMAANMAALSFVVRARRPGISTTYQKLTERCSKAT